MVLVPTRRIAEHQAVVGLLAADPGLHQSGHIPRVPTLVDHFGLALGGTRVVGALRHPAGIPRNIGALARKVGEGIVAGGPVLAGSLNGGVDLRAFIPFTQHEEKLHDPDEVLSPAVTGRRSVVEGQRRRLHRAPGGDAAQVVAQ